ncbi:mediator of RNA polymerase II transcription subunit 30 isoform X1 [Herpailurus yagouaroundi]|uniref:mediator of RNA polymerase II transcription subunit 30 isoform X1 n=1 Tax=Herpailurus yagouaroundi TaxID=1608482 RepID=UPI001AD79F5E|nr:mediator of RNA polymerase II transcription subunit 30 isoform X1 [Puma yagouaroundi]
MSTPPLAASGMAPGPFGGPQAQQAAREVNTASLCRIGQETVQDIVYRTMEIFQLLRNMQLPNGVTYHTGTYQDRLAKLQDHLRQLSILFRKLRLVYDKCNENCGGMDPIPVEQLIPYVEEDGSKNEDRTGPPRFASEERREIAEVNKKLLLYFETGMENKAVNRGVNKRGGWTTKIWLTQTEIQKIRQKRK